MTLKKFILAVLCFSSSIPSFAGAPPGQEWFTLTTKNFRVHHNAVLENYARTLAASFERALPVLEKDLQWKAPVPIDIVVMDPSDMANGMAVSFPNTHIELFSVPFDVDSTLAEYYNWVDELAVHELTHIIANDSALDFYQTLRGIFGSWVKPNGLQASWLIEGLAVYQETAHSRGGRGRSVFLESMLRVGSNEGKLNNEDYIAMDRFNDGAPFWPAGNTPYLFGYTIQAYPQKNLAAKSAHFPGELSIANAGRFPYMPNANVKSIAGKDWTQLWEEAQPALLDRYGTKDYANSKSCALTKSGRFTGGHVLSKDGYLYYTDEDKENGYYLARVKADAACGTDTVERLVKHRFPSPTTVSLSPNQEQLAYAQTNLIEGYKFISDLYLFDLLTHETKRITFEKRARDPYFVNDNTIAFAYNRGDVRQAIAVMNLTTGATHDIFTGRDFERISAISGLGNELLFSLHTNKGAEIIEQVSLKSGIAFPLTNIPRDIEKYHERNAQFLPDGKILFAGNYSGTTQDLFVYDPNSHQRTMVARSASGYLDRPILSADGRSLFAVELQLEGQNLVKIPFNQLDPWIKNVKPVSNDLYQFLTGKESVPLLPLQEDKVTQEIADLKTEPYSAVNTTATSLWPQYWIPELHGAVEGTLIGASTSGNDALEYHKYSLLAEYDTRAKFPTFHAYYLNRQNKLNFLFDADQYNSYFSGSNTSNRVSLYTAEGIFPIGNVDVAFGGSFRQLEFFGSRQSRWLAFQQTQYNSIDQNPQALRPNGGGSVVFYSAYYPSTQLETTFYDLRPSLSLFREGFTPSHSLSLSAFLGISSNDRLASNYYLGGGANQLTSSNYVVRGYATDALLGQKIATANLTYSFPLSHPYHGWNTNPFFVKTIGIDLHLDAGSASRLSLYDGSNFLGYQKEELGRKILIGTGIDFITQGTIFYYMPASIDLGLHYGNQKNFGGGYVFYLGVNLGLDRIGGVLAQHDSAATSEAP